MVIPKLKHPVASKDMVLNGDFFNNLRERLYQFFEENSFPVSHDLNTRRKTISFLPKRLSIPLHVGQIDAVKFFSSFNYPEKILWNARDNDPAFLVFGFMKRFRSWEIEAIQKSFKKNELYDHKIYGSFLFEDSKKTTPPWQGFKGCHWVFPWFEFIFQKKGSKLNLYYQDHKKKQIWNALKKWEASYQKNSSLQDSTRMNKKLSLTYLPQKKKWISKVQKVKKLIQNKKLKKLVLARIIRLNTGRIDISELLYSLRPSFTDHYIFVYQTDPANIFISFSPERLFKRKGNSIYTEAVAGSKKITNKNQNGGHIDNMSKNIAEQRIVEQEIAKTMEKITKEYTLEQKQRWIRYRYIEHIRSTFIGVLKKNYSDIKLLKLFHPTSAVCGLPREFSKKQIDRLEKFKRGLYASPLGYISDRESELCVGIRSILIRKKNTFIFSGAGITDDSSPEQEWEELDYKIKPFLNFFASGCVHRTVARPRCERRSHFLGIPPVYKKNH